MRIISFLIICFSGSSLFTQSTDCYDPIIAAIGSLESQRDPKCHATATRLENFMFGTPLTEDARDLRISKQKELIKTIWLESSTSSDPAIESLTRTEINGIANKKIIVVIKGDNWFVRSKTYGDIPISSRDYRQYTSVAYGLRAILAVQQAALFDVGVALKSLDKESIEALKLISDIATLAGLKLADMIARQKSLKQIDVETFQVAWSDLIISSTTSSTENIGANKNAQLQIRNDYAMTLKTIDQKLESYQNYNKISQAVFLRNIQIYFAKVQWPKDAQEARKVENLFRESLISFASDLVKFAQNRSAAKEETTISYETMRESVNAFLPHNINEFEDAIFYPHLEKSDQVTIEAYDLDAFRDGGLHWQYLKYAIQDSLFVPGNEPDPFAAEYATEALAQLGVLIWRSAGNSAITKGKSHLDEQSMLEGLSSIRQKIQEDRIAARNIREEPRQKIVSSSDRNSASEHKYFLDFTDSSNIRFEHRSSDWLSRQIRSYVIKEDENLARLAIPPAFGGSGVAAEDVNQDGYPDLLFLGGLGLKLYLGKKDGSFNDFTARSGLGWKRQDHNPGEMRQPIIADFDNDGFQDIFISYVNDKHRIYQGRGDGIFVDMTDISDLGGEGLVAGPCTAFDYDKDGLLDIYIGYFGNYLKGDLPTLARDNINGTANKLFRNMGQFKFEEASKNSGVENKGWTQAVGHSDINNDGWQDLIVGNDFGRNSYYINQKNGQFIDIAPKLGTDKPSYTMNVGIADLNRDQYPDFYISNIVVMEKDDKYVLPNQNTNMHFDPNSLASMRVVEANDLFLSYLDSDQALNYEQSDIVGRGYSSTGWSWDADFFDFDNDGDDDLYCLNGMNDFAVYGRENPYYQSPDGDSSKVVFAQSSREPNVFFENKDGELANNSVISGLDLVETSRSAAFLDIDMDGDLDVALNNYHGPAYIFKNRSENTGNNWLKIRLECIDCPNTSRDAIGAKIIVSSDTQTNMWREVHSTTGYLSVHPKEQKFGLLHDKQASIRVIWPDGQEDKFQLESVNTRYLIQRQGKVAKLINMTR